MGSVGKSRVAAVNDIRANLYDVMSDLDDRGRAAALLVLLQQGRDSFEANQARAVRVGDRTWRIASSGFVVAFICAFVGACLGNANAIVVGGAMFLVVAAVFAWGQKVLSQCIKKMERANAHLEAVLDMSRFYEVTFERRGDGFVAFTHEGEEVRQ